MLSETAKYTAIGLLSCTLMACSSVAEKTTWHDERASNPQGQSTYTMQLDALQIANTMQLETLASTTAGADLTDQAANLVTGVQQTLAAISEACLALNNDMLENTADSYQAGDIQVDLMPNHYRVHQVLQGGLMVHMTAQFDASQGCRFDGNHSLNESRRLMVSGELESAKMRMQIQPSPVQMDFAAGQGVSATWSDYGYARQQSTTEQALHNTLLEGHLNTKVSYKTTQESLLTDNTLYK